MSYLQFDRFSPVAPASPIVTTTPIANTARFALLAAVLIAAPLVHTQTGDWEWVGGRNTLPTACVAHGVNNYSCGNRGIYGRLGVPASENIPGGRSSAVTWTGLKGNLWLFGGIGTDSKGNAGLLNDLWQFDPASREWKWVSGSDKVNQSAVHGKLGVPAPENAPESGAAMGWLGGAVGWLDRDGNLWLALDGLWEFDVTAREWIWWGDPMACSDQDRNLAKCPGDRSTAAVWGDKNGNLWIFGGFGEDQVGGEGYLNDLWKFNLGTKKWTFMAGSLRFQYIPDPGGDENQNKGSYGSCGTVDEFDPGNIPGSRTASYAWIDEKGNLWLFGGLGFDCANYDPDEVFGDLNDLWEFDTTKNNWAFMGGSQAIEESQMFYGTPGVLSAQALPGLRDSGMNWTGRDGNLWLFGGSGELDDLWELHPPTLQWVWESGDDTESLSFSATWGTLGEPSAKNDPGPRLYSATWTDLEDNLWLFGGFAYSVTSASPSGSYNDMWKFSPRTIVWPTSAPEFDFSSGNYLPPVPLVLSDFMPAAKIYYTTDGSTPSSESTQYTGLIDVKTSMTIKAIAVAPGMNPSEVAVETYNILKQQTVNWPPLAQSYPVGATVVLSATASSGLPVIFQAEGECSLNTTNTVTFLSAGSCEIEAWVSGNDVYTDAFEFQTVTVTAQ